MRCTACDYPLWGLRPGPCPECGRPFRSDEFEFVPGTVAFRCGGCGQTYYGTDPKGLLMPREFACVRCGAACACGEMAVDPTDRIDPLAGGELLPWIDDRLDAEGRRRRRSLVGRFLATWWWFTARGWRAADAIPIRARAGSAWGLAILASILMGIGTGLPLLVMPVLSLALAAPGAIAPGGRGIAIFLGVMFLMVLGFAAAWLMLQSLTAVLAHAVLRATGPTRAGLGRTTQAVLYPSVLGIWGAIPLCCFGPLGSLLWAAIVACGTVQRMQQVSWARACVAVLVPALGGVLVVAATFALLFVGAGGPQPVLMPPPVPVVAPNAPPPTTVEPIEGEQGVPASGSDAVSSPDAAVETDDGEVALPDAPPPPEPPS